VFEGDGKKLSLQLSRS